MGQPLLNHVALLIHSLNGELLWCTFWWPAGHLCTCNATMTHYCNDMLSMLRTWKPEIRFWCHKVWPRSKIPKHFLDTSLLIRSRDSSGNSLQVIIYWNFQNKKQTLFQKKSNRRQFLNKILSQRCPDWWTVLLNTWSHYKWVFHTLRNFQTNEARKICKLFNKVQQLFVSLYKSSMKYTQHIVLNCVRITPEPPSNDDKLSPFTFAPAI